MVGLFVGISGIHFVWDGLTGTSEGSLAYSI